LASEAYRESGVDLDRMDDLKERIKGFAASTHGPEVLDSSGSFAGLYQLSGYQQPVLVARLRPNWDILSPWAKTWSL